MKKRIAIYLCVVLVLFGLGFLVSGTLVDGDDQQPSGVSAAEPGAGRITEPEPVADPGEQPREADAGPAPAGVRVVGVRGLAEHLGEGRDEWAEIVPGDVLGADDAVRTGEDASVTLGLGTASTVDLGGAAQVRVREVSDSVQRLGLIRGRISVKYEEDGARVLRVENEDGSAVAEARKGAFTVLGSGGTVAVATETGSVDLTAAGRRVTVEAGQQSVAVAGGKPSGPAAIPIDLLLKVTDPGCRVQREAFIVIRGRTAPGSLVRINDTPGAVDAEGRFAVRITLAVGRNIIVVATEDVLGRVKRRTFPCVTVDPGAAIDKIDIQWGAPAGGGKP
ncbi:MAG TPA: FecR family protein [Polyangia bacterium]|nr:FecR family protein [Polyangia bacterium]